MRKYSICAALAAGLLSNALAVSAQDPGEDVTAREQWFWAQRTYPFAERPYADMARLHALVATGMPQFVGRNSTQAPLGGAWRPIGPNGLWDAGSGFFGSGGQLDAGRISAIVPPSQTGGPMYLGTASGGVWQSTNAGITWTPLTDTQCSLTTGAVAVDPVLPSRVYVGTGEGNGGSLGCGVLASNDGGASWGTNSTSGINVSGGGVVSFFTIVVDAATAGTTSSTTLLAGVNFASPGGIARSTNSGASWSLVRTANVGVVTSIVAHPTQQGTYYFGARIASTNAGRGVYRSNDAGATWSQIQALPVTDPAMIGRIQLAVSTAAPHLLWALVANANDNTLLGLYRYDETTNVWTSLAAANVVSNNTYRGDFGAQGVYDLAIAVDPRDAQRMYLAGVRAYKSTDGGQTFQPMGMEIHCDWHVLQFDPSNPDILWAGTDGGVFVSYDAGGTWLARNAGLAITQYYPGISIHPQATRILGGAQDNGTQLYTGSLYWDGFDGGDGGYTAINYHDPSIMWGESQWNKSSGAAIVRRDAVSFRARNNGIVAQDRAQFIPPLVMDPMTPTKLYFGTHRLYRTIDDGVTWTPITGDLTGGTGSITSIAVSPIDTMTIFVGTSDGRAQVSRDGGVTFTLATGLPARTVTRVMPHPADRNRALVTVSGYGTGHVFETTDGFATPVHDVSGNLPNAPTNVAIYIPAQSLMVAGTDIGVFQSADGGATWTLGPTGMPNVIIHDLVYQPSTALLVAATYGRGMFAYDVGSQTAVLRGDANGDGKVDALDGLLVQQALAAAAPAGTAIYPRADANCNGTIDAGDLVLILRAAVGLSTGSACVGGVR